MNDKSYIAGYVGIGVFLILSFEKLYVILSDIIVSILLNFDIKILFVVLTSYLFSSLFCLFIFYIVLNKILSKHKRIQFKKIILFLALFYLFIMIIIGPIKSVLVWTDPTNYVSEERYFNFLKYSVNIEYSIIYSFAWILGIFGIILILFKKIKSVNSVKHKNSEIS